MKISKLILQLQAQQALYGDVDVDARRISGEFSKTICLLGCESGVSIEAFDLPEDEEE